MNKNTNQKMNILSLRILWGAMLASICLMAYGAYLMQPQNVRGPSQVAVILAGVIGISLLIASFFYPRHMFKKDKKRIQDTLFSMGSPKISMHDLVTIYSKSFMTRNSLIELVTLVGLFLANFQGDKIYFFPFAAASVIAFLLNFPSEQKLKDDFFGGSSLMQAVSIVDSAEPLPISKTEIEIPTTEKKKFSWKLILPMVTYFSFGFICSLIFSSYLELQMDNLAPMGIFLSLIVVVSIYLFTTKFAKASDAPKKFNVLNTVLMFPALFIGMFGLSGLICFANQTGDKSVEKTLQVGLVLDKNQTEEELKLNGKCYKLKHPDQNDDHIGYEVFCENKDPLIADKKFEVTYKDGNFGKRWALNYKQMK